MLWLPYRIEAVYVDPDGDQTLDVYYGPDEARASSARVGILHRPSTWDWLDRRSGPFPSHRFVRVDDARIPVCFEGGGAFTFDPVVMVAFLLSGWQELVIRQRDEHGRFPHTASFQHASDSLDVPIVDWMRHIVVDALARSAGTDKTLERKQFGDATWAFCATHDIDYLRKWRPGIWKRELLDRAVLNREGESVGKRLLRARRATWSFFEAGDPFKAALTRIPSELEARRAKGTFFYKAAAHGHRDVAYPVDSVSIRTQIHRQQKAGHEIGLHPSYHTFAHPERLLGERSRLAAVAGQQPTSHRAHYLRFDHPASIHHLVAAGFTIDSTLGWAGHGGFRHGTCLPFPLFDPVSGQETSLWEIPLVTMESALFNRRHLSLEDAVTETRRLMDVCRSFGGVFTGLWHNTLWDEADYPGWGRHFEDTLDAASEGNALMETLSGVLKAWN